MPNAASPDRTVSQGIGRGLKYFIGIGEKSESSFQEQGWASIGVSVAHAIAAVALEMSRNGVPPGLHFGWTRMDMLSASWSYLAFGEGNVPWKVRELIHRAEPDAKKRPRVIVG